jgi:putative ABC transport system permease protein
MKAPLSPEPPRWANRFLEWYCRPELLEEIQGDAYELFDKRLLANGYKVARRAFVWDVLRSFRLSTIRRITYKFSPDMYKSNFKIAWRSLVKHKMYSAIKIGGFAIGIAACLLIALFIKDELSYDSTYPEANRIFRVVAETTEGEFAGQGVDFPAPFAKALKDEFPEFEKVARINPNSLFTGGGNPIRRIDAVQNTYEEGFTFADQELLDILQIKMIYGDRKHALDEPNTIVISERKAQQYFPNENPVGKMLIANDNKDKPVKIGGVMANFPSTSHLQYDFLIAMKGVEFYNGEQSNWGASNYHTYVLLKPGVDIAKLEKKMFSVIIHKYMGAQMSKTELELVERSSRLYLQPISDIHLHSAEIHDGMRHGDIRFVWLFGAIAGFILLIACINFVNLSTARSSNRAKEVGLRKTVGSSRGALIGQFLSESLMFSWFSFVMGVILAWALLPYFNQLSNKTLQFPWLAWWFLPMMVLACLFVGMLAGLYPAFYLSGFNPINVLKGKLSKGSSNTNLRSALVVFQFTTSIVLIIGTLIVTRQMNFILHKKLGFDKEQVLLLNGTQTLGDNLPAFKNRLQQLPMVQSVAVSDYLPVAESKRNGNEFWEAGKDKEGNSSGTQIWQVDSDYIPTLGMKIVEGRNFSTAMKSDSQGVIINQALAKKLNLAPALGKRITNGGQSYQVIGVVEDFHFESLRENIGGMCLVLGNSSNVISVKIKGQEMQKAIQQISAIWKDLAPTQPIRTTFLDDSYAKMYADVRRMGYIFSNFAILAIVVACLGLFALSTYLAEQRRKEIGIRKVLGASVGSVMGLLVRNFLVLILISLFIAVPTAWYLMQKWLEDFVYRYHIRGDVFLLAGFSVILIALLTISVQALRSALSNPLDSLRNE